MLDAGQLAAACAAGPTSYLSLGKQAEAIADYETAPSRPIPRTAACSTTWPGCWPLRRTTELRDGKRAIELAKQACEVTEYKQAHILSTLAASYAESGDFEGHQLVEESGRAGSDALKAAAEPRSSRATRQQKPWREADSARRMPMLARQGGRTPTPTASTGAHRPQAKTRGLSVDRSTAWDLVCEYTASDSSAQAHAGGRGGHAGLRPQVRRGRREVGHRRACCTTSTTSAGPNPPDHPLQGRGDPAPSAAIPTT